MYILRKLGYATRPGELKVVTVVFVFDSRDKTQTPAVFGYCGAITVNIHRIPTKYFTYNYIYPNYIKSNFNFE